MRAGVVGAGSWGTAFAALLARQGLETVLWAREPEVVEGINEGHRNPFFLTDCVLPEGLWCSGDLAEVARGRDLLVMAVPSQWAGETAASLKGLVGPETAVLNLAKGFDPATRERLSVVIGRNAGVEEPRLAVLSGPNHAEEVIRGVPSAAVVASSDRELARRLQRAVNTPYFRIYTNRDVAGVEVGAAYKNVIAIAAGVVDGMGLGDNTKATLVTRGLSEVMRFGAALGARECTFSGLSGIGDIMVTCYSRHSRNRGLGEKIGAGMTLEEATRDMKMVVEGVYATGLVFEIARERGVEVPIAGAVHDLLQGGTTPARALERLMTRRLKEESSEESIIYGAEPEER